MWTLRLVRAYNTGTAFSLGAGLGPFIGLLAVVVVVLLVRFGRTVVSPVGDGRARPGAGRRARQPGSTACCATADGFLDGAVIDFIDLQWWPMFNVADSAIVVGGRAAGAERLRAVDRPALPVGPGLRARSPR